MGVGCKDMGLLLLSAELSSHTLLSAPDCYPSKPPALCPCSHGNSPAVSVTLVTLVTLATLVTLVSFVSFVSLVSVVSLCYLVHIIACPVSQKIITCLRSQRSTNAPAR